MFYVYGSVSGLSCGPLICLTTTVLFDSHGTNTASAELVQLYLLVSKNSFFKDLFIYFFYFTCEFQIQSKSYESVIPILLEVEWNFRLIFGEGIFTTLRIPIIQVLYDFQRVSWFCLKCLIYILELEFFIDLKGAATVYGIFFLLLFPNTMSREKSSGWDTPRPR